MPPESVNEPIVVGKKNTREFIAKAWINPLKDNSGNAVVNMHFDQDIEVQITNKKTGKSYIIGQGVALTGFPNKKREGKQDPDLRFSFVK